MSTETKKRQLAWAQLITKTIETASLYGRSFTAGVALFMLASEGWLDEDMEAELEDLIRLYVGEDLIATMEERGLSTWTRKIVHIIDLAVLDEIARELEGETEED